MDLRLNLGLASLGASGFTAAASPVLPAESLAIAWALAALLALGAIVLPYILED